MTRVLAAALICGLAGGVQAATIGEEDGIVINPLPGGAFEVVQGTNFGAAEYWCGAATFIERRSGRSELTPIYVQKPLGPSLTVSGRRGVVFTTDPAGLPPAQQRVTVTVETPGVMLKSVQARRFCRDAFTRSTK